MFIIEERRIFNFFEKVENVPKKKNMVTIYFSISQNLSYAFNKSNSATRQEH